MTARAAVIVIDLAEIEAVTERTDAQAEIPEDRPHTRLGREIVTPLCEDLAQRWAKQLEKITIGDLTGRLGKDDCQPAPSRPARAPGGPGSRLCRPWAR